MANETIPAEISAFVDKFKKYCSSVEVDYNLDTLSEQVTKLGKEYCGLYFKTAKGESEIKRCFQVRKIGERFYDLSLRVDRLWCDHEEYLINAPRDTFPRQDLHVIRGVAYGWNIETAPIQRELDDPAVQSRKLAEAVEKGYDELNPRRFGI